MTGTGADDGDSGEVRRRTGSPDIRAQALYDQLDALEREMKVLSPEGMWQSGGFALVVAAAAIWVATTQSVEWGAALGLVVLLAIAALLRNRRKLKKLESERDRVVEQLGRAVLP